MSTVERKIGVTAPGEVTRRRARRGLIGAITLIAAGGSGALGVQYASEQLSYKPEARARIATVVRESDALRSVVGDACKLGSFAPTLSDVQGMRTDKNFMSLGSEMIIGSPSARSASVAMVNRMQTMEASAAFTGALHDTIRETRGAALNPATLSVISQDFKADLTRRFGVLVHEDQARVSSAAVSMRTAVVRAVGGGPFHASAAELGVTPDLERTLVRPTEFTTAPAPMTSQEVIAQDQLSGCWLPDSQR